MAVSIVVPVRNEADNVAPLDCGDHSALDGRWAYEIIYVNDGSTDATAERLAALMKQHGNLRQIRHEKSSGQSAAVRSGVRAARGTIVATLDGDGQNNPAFLPDLIAAVENGGGRIGLVAGQRVGRKDTGFKKMQSRIANGVRKRDPARRYPRHRLRAEGVSARVVPVDALFRRAASFPAGASASRGF